MLGLEGGGDPVQVVKIKVKTPGRLFDPEEVPPKVTPTQVVPDGEKGFNSEVGSDGEFINGDS